MNARWEDLEVVRYYCIAEAVEDHVDLHTLGGFAYQVFLELLSHGVAFPDECFQENALLGSVNGSEHRIVEVTAIIIDLQYIVSNTHFIQVWMWEAAFWPMLLALR